jgi:hypothetical protein
VTDARSVYAGCSHKGCYRGFYRVCENSPILPGFPEVALVYDNSKPVLAGARPARNFPEIWTALAFLSSHLLLVRPVHDEGFDYGFGGRPRVGRRLAPACPKPENGPARMDRHSRFASRSGESFAAPGLFQRQRNQQTCANGRVSNGLYKRSRIRILVEK